MSSSSDSAAFEYVIIGAGSAGSVLAQRLSEQGGVRVLVLEAGGSERSVIVSMPAALTIPMNTKRYNWGMKTEPEPAPDGRCINLPRGKGMRGSSSINGMCHVRGNPMDYELWSAKGATGLHWANVLPYFQRAEGVRGAGLLRGTSGPLKVTRGPETNPLYHAFVDAAVQAGYPRSAKMNEVQHEGFGPMEMTVGDGRRCGAAVAYLRPALKNPNVHLITHATVTRILFDSKTAVGVKYLHHGHTKVARAAHEVILSAGSIMSPVILKRSGVGPAAEMAQHGISVVHAVDGVGENLMDHLELYVQYACSHPDDWTEMRAYIRLSREIFSQSAMQPCLGAELAPGRNRTTRWMPLSAPRWKASITPAAPVEMVIAGALPQLAAIAQGDLDMNPRCGTTA